MVTEPTSIARRALAVCALGVVVAAVPALAATVRIGSTVTIKNEGSTFKGK